jgi:hypothetical protein
MEITEIKATLEETRSKAAVNQQLCKCVSTPVHIWRYASTYLARAVPPAQQGVSKCDLANT